VSDRFLYLSHAEPVLVPAPPVDAWQPHTDQPTQRGRTLPRDDRHTLVVAPILPAAFDRLDWVPPLSEPVRRVAHVLPQLPYWQPRGYDETELVDPPYLRMPWPELSQLPPATVSKARGIGWRDLPSVADPTPWQHRWYADLRGLWRIFNEAEYRFYWGTSPPAEGDTPDATSASLPHTPADTFADGVHYLSASYFNGVLDSGFLALGPQGETYLRLEIADGAEAGNPPAAPLDVRLEVAAGGVITVHALYIEPTASLRATQWAIGYTTDGSTPPADDPDVTSSLGESLLSVLDYSLPAQADGTTVKVRVQTRRNDGTEETPSWVYSASSVVSAEADATGPTVPLRIEGATPEQGDAD